MTTLRTLVWRFYAYRITVSNGFWLPVGVLYLQRVRGFDLGEVGMVMGGFSVAMVLAEVPTGYVGDRLGRRASLVLGNVVLATFMVGHTVVETPLAFLGLYAFWAFGWAFRSGTADAWLYELLAAHGKSEAFARISGRSSTVQKVFEAATAVVAGWLVVVDWSLPFLANAVVAAAGVVVLATFPESGSDGSVSVEDGVGGDRFTIRRAARTVRTRLARPGLRWFVVYGALFSSFYQVVRDFEQPALEAVGVPPAALGVVYAGFKLCSALAASAAGWVLERVGVRGAFGLLVPAYAVAFLGVLVAPALVVPVLVANRSLGVLMGPIRRQYVNDRITDDGRATVLSAVSMVLLLGGGVAKLLAGVVATRVGLLRFFAVGGVLVAAVGGLLWLAVRPVRAASRSDVGAGVVSE